MAIHPRIGLECYLEAPEGNDWLPTGTAFLDALVGAGLCVPSKRDGLLGWPRETNRLLTGGIGSTHPALSE